MKKRYGQHFLSDRSILRRVVDFAQIGPESTVIEIGPGAGALTRELAAKAARIIAIEIDSDLIPALRSESPPNVAIIEGDALEIELEKLADGPFHVVGNLPYNIATPLLKRFIQKRRHIIDATMMIQEEVARRIVAEPGSGDYGPLSVLIQYYAQPGYGFRVPPGAFRPRPKVDSAVLRLEWRTGVVDAPEFTDFVHDVFGSRRKKLVNNLLRLFPAAGRKHVLDRLAQARVPLNARPAELSVTEFLRVYNQFR